MTNLIDRAVELTAKLSLEEKVSLLTGKDFWNTVPLESVGLRNLLLSDGPAGVRGEWFDERDNSLNLPSGSSLGSTWSKGFAAEYGRTLAREAARKGVDVVLGPTINLHRTPLGGRHFECLSEDAMLTGALAASFVTGIQSLGKGACPKHYIANDAETDRYTANSIVDERTLREVYMRPFEDAIVKGGAWTIMSSYNQINGQTASESDLLKSPLRDEWHFDGVVISDWTAVRSLESAKFEQDLVMPGPVGPWGDALVSAVRSGEIAESTIDRKIVRMITLAIRVGAIGDGETTPPQPPRHNNIPAEGRIFARAAASEGSVLLKNDGILPLNFKLAGKVALLGHNADAARTQGGGSAGVMPEQVVTPLEALKALVGDNLSYSIGSVVQKGIGELKQAQLANPLTGNPGVQVEFLDDDFKVIYSEERLASSITWLGSDAPVEAARHLRLTTQYTPNETASQLFGCASAQPTKVTIDGQLVAEEHLSSDTKDPFMALMNPPHFSTKYDFVAGKAVDIVIEADMRGRTGLGASAISYRFGFEADASNEQRLIDDAVANAKSADLAIIVVGTNAQVESEGFDRENLDLPGRQNDLVDAVVAVNPNTVVIVNSGSPVILPWRNKVRAILLTYFAGEQMGNAVVDMLTGATEPGGRLPTTWAQELTDVPVLNSTPDENMNLPYEEGIHIGYRAFLKAGVKPAFNFGFGLGYTTWTIDSVSLPKTVAAGQDFAVEVVVTNTGNRAGKHVVQVYAERKDSAIDRPVRWLVGFADLRAESGETVTASIEVLGREFANFDKGWNYESGNFELHVGSSVAEIAISQTVTLT